MAESSIIPRMNWHGDPEQSIHCDMFKQQCNLYFSVKNIKKEKQVDHVLLFTGEEGIRIFNSWSLDDNERKSPDIVWQKFQNHVTPKSNFSVSRLQMQSIIQKSDESFDAFIAKLKLQALKCKFTDHVASDERVLEQVIAGWRSAKLQKELLEKGDTYTLIEAIELGRTHEAASSICNNWQKFKVRIFPQNQDYQ